MAYAERQYTLYKQDKQGVPLIDHLRHAARQGLKSPLLTPLPLPQLACRTWEWFLELSKLRDRESGSLSWSDVQAWAHLRKQAPRQYELQWILELDVLYHKIVKVTSDG